MRNGDFSNTSSFSTLGNSFVSTVPNNLVNGRVPASQIDPNGQKLMRLFPLPNVDPALRRATTTRRTSNSIRTCTSG